MNKVLYFLMNRVTSPLRIQVASDTEAGRIWRELKLAIYVNARFSENQHEYLDNCRQILDAIRVFNERRFYTDRMRLYYSHRRDVLRVHGFDLDMWYSLRSMAIMEFLMEYRRMRVNRCWMSLSRDTTHRCSYCFIGILQEEHEMFYSKKAATEEFPRGVLDLHCHDIVVLINLDEVLREKEQLVPWYDNDPLEVERMFHQEEQEAFAYNPACVI